MTFFAWSQREGVLFERQRKAKPKGTQQICMTGLAETLAFGALASRSVHRLPASNTEDTNTSDRGLLSNAKKDY